MWEEKDCPDENKIGKGEPILMQYTGLKDKNGKEIYSGDIVSSIGGKYGTDICIIRDCVGGFECEMINGFSTGSTFTFSFLNEKSCEIIGNIYENPELLNS